MIQCTARLFQHHLRLCAAIYERCASRKILLLLKQQLLQLVGGAQQERCRLTVTCYQLSHSCHLCGVQFVAQQRFCLHAEICWPCRNTCLFKNTYLTLIIWTLNPYVAAAGHRYFCFKCPVLHQNGEYFHFIPKRYVSGKRCCCSTNKGYGCVYNNSYSNRITTLLLYVEFTHQQMHFY